MSPHTQIANDGEDDGNDKTGHDEATLLEAGGQQQEEKDDQVQCADADDHVGGDRTLRIVVPTFIIKHHERHLQAVIVSHFDQKRICARTMAPATAIAMPMIRYNAATILMPVCKNDMRFAELTLNR